MIAEVVSNGAFLSKHSCDYVKYMYFWTNPLSDSHHVFHQGYGWRAYSPASPMRNAQEIPRRTAQMQSQVALTERAAKTHNVGNR